MPLFSDKEKENGLPTIETGNSTFTADIGWHSGCGPKKEETKEGGRD